MRTAAYCALYIEGLPAVTSILCLQRREGDAQHHRSYMAQVGVDGAAG